MHKLLSLFFAVSTIATAQGLAVMQDDGNTVPSAHYLAHFFSTDVNETGKTPSGLSLVNFPVESQHLQAGVLAQPLQIARPEWLMHPLFLIGDDTRSRDWLVNHLPDLQKIGAYGLVVHVTDLTAFTQLQTLAQGIPLAPATGDHLIPALTVYPVLIHANGQVTQ